MKLIFTDQYANLLFLINGLVVVLYLAAMKKKKQRAMKFGNYETLQKVAGRKFLKSNHVGMLLRLMAFTALIIGISSPVLIHETTAASSDYVLAIDSSSSMMAGDIDPTRFQAAKDISSNFVTELSAENQVGVVSFAGKVNKEVTLLEDKENISSTIRDIQIGETAGTAIGDSLITSSSMLMNSNGSRKVVLITDGRNNVGTSINESLKFAKNNNVTVNAIGIGSQKNTTQEYGIISGQNATRVSFPNLDQESLYRISNQTGGEFITVTSRDQFRTAFTSMEKEERERDISRYFIFLAVVIMLLEWLMGSTRYSVIP